MAVGMDYNNTTYQYHHNEVIGRNLNAIELRFTFKIHLDTVCFAKTGWRHTNCDIFSSNFRKHGVCATTHRYAVKVIHCAGDRRMHQASQSRRMYLR